MSFIQPAVLDPLSSKGRETMRFTTTYRYTKTPQQLQNWLNPANVFKSLFLRQIKKVELSSPAPQLQDANFRSFGRIRSY